MQLGILLCLLLGSSSLFFSSVVCDPNHHHNHHNDFPWQNILSSLGIIVENQTNIISNAESSGDTSFNTKERYTSDSTVEMPTVKILKSETKDEIEIPAVVQNGTYNSRDEGLGMGYKVGIPIVSIVFFICFWYCICKCCCACCRKETPGVVVMQSNTVQAPQTAPAAPQIILQQPIIHQAAPVYDAQQRWAPPPPQGHPQWNQPPHGHSQWNQPSQGPQQWALHPMCEQQQYSPHSGYDNPGFNPATAPPPYNTEKY